MAVALDGAPVPAAAWARTPVRPGATLTVRVAAGDPGGGDSNPLQTLASVGGDRRVALHSRSARPRRSGGRRAGAAIMVGGSLITGALFPPAPPEAPEPAAATGATTYSIAGGGISPARISR